MKLVDPSLPITVAAQVPGGYTYAPAVGSSADTMPFTATATRATYGSFTIDQDGSLSGSVTVCGSTITPGSSRVGKRRVERNAKYGVRTYRSVKH